MRRAKHNLSHYRVTAGDMGMLYPVSCTEILPGDTFRQSSSALVRMQPLMTPLMHPLRVSIASFFVPNRLVWDGWEAFITARADTNIPTVPNDTANGVLDFLGSDPRDQQVNALPLYGYNLIWNEYYRDQDIQSERTNTDNTVANVQWSKDYFTTARTQPQKGQAVQIQFSAGSAPLASVGQSTFKGSGQSDTTGARAVSGEYGNLPRPGLPTNPDGSYNWANVAWADLSQATGGIDINEWRRAMALQRFLEHRNKFGSRYKDMLAFLGVNSSDARLDRPEYLGGGRQTIAFSEVLQTVEDPTNQVPLGTQGGHGIASISTRPWRRFFEEHGYIITLMSLRPTSMYSNGQDRTFTRSVRDDFWQKENEMLGEQPVNLTELYAAGASDAVFGYSPRHDDYRSQRSYPTGPMRTSSQNTWHMAREFSSAPGLNDEFLKCVPTKRVLRSTNDPAFYAMVQNRVAARRLVSKYARN